MLRNQDCTFIKKCQVVALLNLKIKDMADHEDRKNIVNYAWDRTYTYPIYADRIFLTSVQRDY